MNRNEKKIIIILLSILLFVFNGCQATPTEQVVINKNDGNLERQLQESSQFQPENYSERWAETITFDEYTIIIDALIHTPEATQVPVCSMVDYSFSQGEVDKLINYFVGDIPLQTMTDQLTKQECEEMIIILKREISLWERYNSLSNIEKASITNGRSPEENIKSLKERLQKIEQEYETAPETKLIGNIEIDINTLTEDRGIINGLADLGRPMPASITVGDMFDNGGGVFKFKNYVSSIGILVSISDEELNELKSSLNISENDAKELALKVLDDLGLQNYGIRDIEVLPQNIGNKKTAYYNIKLEKLLGNIPINQLMAAPELQEEGNQAYAPELTDESLSIQIDDTGVIGIDWVSPYKIIQEINDNVKIIGFDEVKDIFKKDMNFKKWRPDDSDNKEIVEITDIYLGMMLIKEQNNNDSILAIPVWDFAGVSYSSEKADDAEFIKQLKNGNALQMSYLTINAIDGSSINRYLRY